MTVTPPGACAQPAVVADSPHAREHLAEEEPANLPCAGAQASQEYTMLAVLPEQEYHATAE